MRISDWSSDVCSSDLGDRTDREYVDADASGSGEVDRAAVDVDGTVGDHVDARLVVAGQIDGAAVDGPVVIGRASFRERVCQYVLFSVFAVSLKKTLLSFFFFFFFFFFFLFLFF